jgi:cyclase
MLKKRIIGVVTIRNGWVVQSMGYENYLPIGKPEIVIENLDRWGVDEILIQAIDRSKKNLGPDLQLIHSISLHGNSTPIIYGGGIRTAADAIEVIQSGADRICIDYLLHTNPEEVEKMSYHLGAQAIIANFPLVLHNDGSLWWHDYITKQDTNLTEKVNYLLEQGIISEIIITDYKNEGYPQAFNFKLLDMFINSKIPCILFGGLSSIQLLNQALLRPEVIAVAIGNFLNYREHAVQKIKEQLINFPIRSPLYKDELIVI